MCLAIITRNIFIVNVCIVLQDLLLPMGEPKLLATTDSLLHHILQNIFMVFIICMSPFMHFHAGSRICMKVHEN